MPDESPAAVLTPRPDKTPPTSVAARVCECVHLLGLAVWFGAVSMSAVVAAVVFPLMRRLDPTLGKYPLYTGDHAMLAGGHVGNSVFFVADIVQFACAGLVLLTTILLVGFLGWPMKRVATAVRLLAIGGALMVVSYHLMVLAPRMSENLHEYWALAEAGQTEQAEAARARFSADHPKARNTLTGTAGFVLVAFLAGVWVVQPRGGGEKRTPSGLEKPRLAGGV